MFAVCHVDSITVQPCAAPGLAVRVSLGDTSVSGDALVDEGDLTLASGSRTSNCGAASGTAGS